MSSNDTNMPPPLPLPSSDDFKKPPSLITVGKIGGKITFKTPEPPKSSCSKSTVGASRNEDRSLSKAFIERSDSDDHFDQIDTENEKQTFPPQNCPYDEPPWGGQPHIEYRLSVLKSGTIIGSEELRKSSFVIGRHQNCDLVMEHPSISRFHAVLQYRKPHPDATDAAKRFGGFYLFDLGSTHDTHLNRQRIDPKCYRRVRVGHHIKFGFSSRVFILEGPAEDEEEESELSVTEIIEQRKKRESEWKEMLEAEKKAKEEAAKKRDEEEKNAGVSWGMSDDAVEDEEESSACDVNPFALTAGGSANEELYLDDPKKTLRGWFEREGYELEYHVEEKGSQQFLCRIELPIDTGGGSAVFAEVCLKGRKKEAVAQCALEACRILDRHGELRKAHHEGRERKLKKNWKENDYYDSDEDEFLDRTGELASKREQRKARLEKVEQVETYDSLKEKLACAEKTIKEINESLEKSKAIEAASKASSNAGDTLDSFMKQLKAGTALDKAKRSQLRLELARLMAERVRLIRLVNIAKPAELPPLETRRSNISGGTLSASSVSTEQGTRKLIGPMIGARLGKRRPVLPLSGMPAKVMRMQMGERGDEPNLNEPSAEVEEDEDDDDDDELEAKDEVDEDSSQKTEPIQKSSKRCGKDISEGSEFKSNVGDTIDRQITNKQTANDAKPTEVKEHEPVKFQQRSSSVGKRTIGPTIPPNLLEVLAKEADESGGSERRRGPPESKKASRIQPTLNAAVAEKIREASAVSADEHFEDWVPPAGQTGDGMTALNDKLGY